MDSKIETPRNSMEDNSSDDLDLSEIHLLAGQVHPRRVRFLQDSQKHICRRWTRRLTILGVCLILTLSGTAIYFWLPSAYGLAPSGREFGDCGHSVAEARAKGCVFDNISYAWVRPACYHSELLLSFRNRSSSAISYYRDRDFTPENQIPEDEINAGDWPHAWATGNHHPVHCAFILSKIHRAFEQHLPIDSRATDFEHTIHCGKVLMDGWLHEMEQCQKPGGCRAAKLTALFTSCGYI